jgi:hypothetical protein
MNYLRARMACLSSKTAVFLIFSWWHQHNSGHTLQSKIAGLAYLSPAGKSLRMAKLIWQAIDCVSFGHLEHY